MANHLTSPLMYLPPIHILYVEEGFTVWLHMGDDLGWRPIGEMPLDEQRANEVAQFWANQIEKSKDDPKCYVRAVAVVKTRTEHSEFKEFYRAPAPGEKA